MGLSALCFRSHPNLGLLEISLNPETSELSCLEGLCGLCFGNELHLFVLLFPLITLSGFDVYINYVCLYSPFLNFIKFVTLIFPSMSSRQSFYDVGKKQ